MATLYTHKDQNVRKTYLLVFLFFVFNIIVGSFFYYVMDDPFAIFIALAWSFVGSFIGFWWSDSLVMFMHKAKEIDRESNKQIYNLVENLCIAAGLPVPKIYIIDSEAMNAFATGRNPKNASIALTSGIIDKLEKAELEGVIAHELSHIGNRDVLLATMIIVLVGALTILASIFRRWKFFGGSRRRNNDLGQLGAIIMVVAVILSILSPIIAKIIQLTISRKREFLADADAGLLTRYPEGLASALEKISKDGNILTTANQTSAHLFIADPIKKKSFITKMFMTHPPVEERIAALRDQEVK